jgi:hypothetical protein
LSGPIFVRVSRSKILLGFKYRDEETKKEKWLWKCEGIVDTDNDGAPAEMGRMEGDGCGLVEGMEDGEMEEEDSSAPSTDQPNTTTTTTTATKGGKALCRKGRRGGGGG